MGVEIAGGASVVQWRGTGADVDTHHDVSRKTEPAGSRERVASVQATTRNDGVYSWRDTNARPERTYNYGVVTVDDYGNTSPMTVQ